MSKKRRERKDEHIENYLKSRTTTDNLFEDVYIEHQALSDINFDEIDTSIEFMGRRISMPIMVNAMTGGGEIGRDINENLSSLCQKFNIPMAVGSEAIAIDDEETRESFSLMKEKDIVRIGNLGSERDLEDFTFAKDLIKADAMQVHLNMAQELAMGEGDRDFSNTKACIKNLVDNFDLPIIVKETGCGISQRVAKDLVDIGIQYIDISGKGGTNFLEIEDLRNVETDFSDLYDWGIPSAKSIIDARRASEDVFIIASGGIKTGLDVVKSIILGADMAAMSGEILRYLLMGGYEILENFLKELRYKIKMIMCLLGVKNIEELKKVDYKLTGRLKDLVD